MIPADIAPARIQTALATSRFGRSLDVRLSTGSTNDDARAALAAGAADGHVVLADSQRAGRGARGHTWDSPPGVDLYLSIAARIATQIARLPPLTLAVGLGVARACEEWVEEVEIKWPNDVRVDDRKCAGVLVESVSVGARVDGVVIGIGLDVNRERWPEELEGLATSLARVRGRPLDRGEVFARVLARVEEEVDRFIEHGPSAIVPGVERRLAWRGREVECDASRGTLLGIRSDGALRLGTSRGEKIVRSGSLRLGD